MGRPCLKGLCVKSINVFSNTLDEEVIEVTETIAPLAPLLSVIPLQLLSYHVAVAKGLNVDQPRNLAKSVTVE